MENNQEPVFGHGKICYLEIPTTDLEQSRIFYQEVFNWEFRIRGDGSVAFDDSAGQVSGSLVSTLVPATTLSLLIYIMVDDVAATLAQIAAQGGKMVQPIGLDAPEVTAHFADPSGNILGLFSEGPPKDKTPGSDYTASGKICYVEVPAIDPTVSALFFESVFGWNMRTRRDGRSAFDDGVRKVSGFFTVKRKPSAQPGLLLSIMVDDAEASVAAIRNNGGNIIQEIGADFPEITARFTDPAGNPFSIYQHRGSES